MIPSSCAHSTDGLIIADSTVKRTCCQCANHKECLVSFADLLLKYQEGFQILEQYCNSIEKDLPLIIAQLNIALQDAKKRLTHAAYFSQLKLLKQLPVHTTLPQYKDEDLVKIVQFAINKQQLKEMRKTNQEVNSLYTNIQELIDKINEVENPPHLNRASHLIKSQCKPITDKDVIQESQKADWNPKVIKNFKHLSIPTKQFIEHIYSVTFLNDRHLGIAMGRFHPFFIYDLGNQTLIAKIQIEKIGFYDSVPISEDNFVVACQQTIRMYRIKENLEAMDLEFKNTDRYFNKLHFNKKLNLVLGNNSGFSDFQRDSCISQWNLKTGELFKYQHSGTHCGQICLFEDDQNFAFVVKQENKRKQGNSKVLIWRYNEQKPYKTLTVNDKLTCIIQQSEKLIAFGVQQMYVWVLSSNYQKQVFDYPKDMKIQPVQVRLCESENKRSFILGDKHGGNLKDYKIRNLQGGPRVRRVEPTLQAQLSGDEDLCFGEQCSGELV